MSMLPEKFEDCPRCGAPDGPLWHYDFQACGRCGYSRLGLPLPPPAGDAR